MWMKQLVALLGLSVINCISAQLVDNFVCPDEFEGYYPHLYSCDRYWKCIDGRESLETCGMVWPLMTLIQPLPPKIVIMSTMLIVATGQN